MLIIFTFLGCSTKEFLEISFTTKPNIIGYSLTSFSNSSELIVLSPCSFTFSFSLLLLLGISGNPMSLIFLPLKKKHEFDRLEMIMSKSYIHDLPKMICKPLGNILDNNKSQYYEKWGK
jgi:hypothetical protein